MATQLSRTFSSQGNQRKFTISVWTKRGKTGTVQSIMGSGGGGAYASHMYFMASDEIEVWNYFNSSYAGRYRTKAKYRDTNAWYHVVIAVDTAQSTDTDRFKMYVNGELIDNYFLRNNTSQNQTWEIGHTGAHYIGGYGEGADYEGLMSHFHYCDNYCYQASDFGETDSVTGEWKIKTSPSVSYGTSGSFILKDGNSVTDQSGLGNNWTVANGTLTKTEDCPNNVFATWNSLWSQSNGNVGDVTFSNGNLTTITTSNYRTTPANLGMKTGKYYWEVKRNETGGSADLHGGIMSELATPANTATWIGNAANGWVNAGDGGDKYTGGTNGGSTGATASGAGDIMMFAYDADNGKLYFGVNGSWGNSANPATGANPHYDSLDTTLFYFPCVSTGSDCSANFGNGYFGTTYVSSAGTNASGIGIFEYDVPAGFTALSTKGINE